MRGRVPTEGRLRVRPKVFGVHADLMGTHLRHEHPLGQSALGKPVDGKEMGMPAYGTPICALREQCHRSLQKQPFRGVLRVP